MLGKLGNISINAFIVLLLSIAVAVIAYSMLSDSSSAASSIEKLSPDADKVCLQQNSLAFMKNKMTDKDKDQRNDLCDSCVCSVGCHNDNDDHDGDKLPSKCDANDNDPANTKFHPTNCKKGTNLFERNGIKQCIPS